MEGGNNNVQVQWRSMGEGLVLDAARDVAKLHRLAIDVVLKGWYVEVVDGIDDVDAALAAVEDHVMIHKDDNMDVMKMSNYDAFRVACEVNPPQQQGVRLSIVIMPYADLGSCIQLDVLAQQEPQFVGYARIEIVNRDTLVWKKRDMQALEAEANCCRRGKQLLEDIGRNIFPAIKFRKLTHTMDKDREIAMKRLIKSHLNAREYGYAHDVMMLLGDGKRKHNQVFLSAGCCDPCLAAVGVVFSDEQRAATAAHLENYRIQLSQKFGPARLDPYPERSIILEMAAQSKFKTDLADARRQVMDVLENAAEDIERIARQLDSITNMPALLGCGI